MTQSFCPCTTIAQSVKSRSETITLSVNPCLLVPGLPENLTHHAEPHLGIAFLHLEAHHHPPYLLSRRCFSRLLHIPTTAQRLKQNLRQPLYFRGFGRYMLTRLGHLCRPPSKLINAHCHCLPQVHRDMFVPRRNPHQPVTMAQVFIGQSEFFRAKQQCHRPFRQLLLHQLRALLQHVNPVMQFAFAHSRGPHHKAAVRNRLCNAAENLRVQQYLRSSHGGACAEIGRFPRRHQSKMFESKITHRTRCRADIQRVSRAHQHYAQSIEPRFYHQRSNRCLQKSLTRCSSKEDCSPTLFATNGLSTQIRKAPIFLIEDEGFCITKITSPPFPARGIPATCPCLKSGVLLPDRRRESTELPRCVASASARCPRIDRFLRQGCCCASSAGRDRQTDRRAPALRVHPSPTRDTAVEVFEAPSSFRRSSHIPDPALCRSQSASSSTPRERLRR